MEADIFRLLGSLNALTALRLAARDSKSPKRQFWRRGQLGKAM